MRCWELPKDPLGAFRERVWPPRAVGFILRTALDGRSVAPGVLPKALHRFDKAVKTPDDDNAKDQSTVP